MGVTVVDPRMSDQAVDVLTEYLFMDERGTATDYCRDIPSAANKTDDDYAARQMQRAEVHSSAMLNVIQTIATIAGNAAPIGPLVSTASAIAK